MNEQDRVELERLKRRQETLQMEVARLTAELEKFHGQLEKTSEPASPISATNSPALEIPPFPIKERQSPRVDIPAELVHARLTPPPLPPSAAAPAAAAMSIETPETKTSPAAESPQPPPLAAHPQTPETFEMRVGTYWLVRVGIVMLLTGLVFLGTYAYKNFIGRLGPGGKVTLLYVAGGALLGAGAWLQRKREKESLRNYGQVLFAGGLAAVYFTTYAAHYVAVLRVIVSPLLDGLLLLAWAAFIVWIADRRKSEVLAVFAVALGYYTSAITDIGLFTLYSNGVLTVAAVFFLIRNRWTTLSFISVVATYSGFAFWRFHGNNWSWNAYFPELWYGNFFLGAYWVMFTAAVFLSRGENLRHGNRALYSSLNNGAFFGLTLLSMLHTLHGNFWKFSLGFGVALLGCAQLARRFLANEPLVKNSYMTQGLVFVTMGFIAYFTGLKLALVLAAESVVLTVLGHQQKNPFLRVGGYASAILSAAWTVMFVARPLGLWLGTSVGTLLLFNGWWEHRAHHGKNESAVRPAVGYFVAFAFAVWGVVTWRHTPEAWRGAAFGIEAVIFTASFYLLRIRELPLFGQSFGIAGQAWWFFYTALGHNKPPWPVPAILIACTLVLSHWWQRQKQLAARADVRNVLQIVYGIALVGVLFFWLQPHFAPASWLAFLNVLAIALTIYGVATRTWILAACAQLFLLVSATEFVRQLLAGRPGWHMVLVPIATLLMIGTVTTAWLSSHKVRPEISKPLFQISVAYRWVAFAMSLWWIYEYVPVLHQFWVLVLLGTALLGIAGWLRNREALLFCASYLVVGFVEFVFLLLDRRPGVFWPNLAAIVGVLALQQLVRRQPERFALPPNCDAVIIATAGLTLWLFLSRWVVLKSGGAHFYLTASWAALAFLLFSSGFVLRERMYRWLGLAILACAIGRVFMFDVWKLEKIYRILSFLALGVVLLALGFIYNKYQEKIRQWL